MSMPPREAFQGPRRRVEPRGMTKRRKNITISIAISFIAGLIVFWATFASGSVANRTATLETGDFSQFDQVTAVQGSISTTTNPVFEGTKAAKATYFGGPENGYARGIFEPSIPAGTDFWYEARFFLPNGFYAAKTGYMAIMRWDTWGIDPPESGGIAIYSADDDARLVGRNYYTGSTQDVLVGPWHIPEGRWVRLTVHQRLSTGADALSEVYQDGALIGRSTAPNSYGTTVTRVRYGIVAVGPTEQLQPVTLYFDNAYVGGSSPLSGGTSPSPAPEPAPAPTPSPSPTPAPSPNQPPSVDLTAPSSGTTFSSSLPISANASDDKGVSRVEFWANGKQVNTDYTAPYSYTYSPHNKGRLAYGDYKVTAEAFDAAGLSASDSATVTRTKSGTATVQVSSSTAVKASATDAVRDFKVHGRVSAASSGRAFVRLERYDSASGAYAPVESHWLELSRDGGFGMWLRHLVGHSRWRLRAEYRSPRLALNLRSRYQYFHTS
jgi:hypothetical protein